MADNGPKNEIALAKYKKDIALAEYKEVVIQFRKLTDIRFKLLTYLPLGTAAGAFLSETKDPVKQRAISAFAFVVTLCIATYDKRNDQHYDELVSRAAELERDLAIENGTFSSRPTPWLKYGFVPPDLPESWLKFRSIRVEHRWPIGLIYAAACCLWAHLFVSSLNAPLWLQFTAPAAVILGWIRLRRIEKDREDEQRKAVRSLMEHLLGSTPQLRTEQAAFADKIASQGILSVDQNKAERRVAYHWNGDEQKTDARTRGASALIAAVIDLPARWIEDVWTGRR